MKKGILVFCIAVLCFSVFASFDLISKDDESLTLQLYSLESLYTESIADPYSYNTRLSYDYALDLNKRPRQVLCVVKDYDGSDFSTSYVYLPVDSEDGDYNSDESRTYVNMKPSISLNLLRFEYEKSGSKIPKLQFEVNLDGYINTVFNGFGRNDTLDFDGSFLIGGTLKVDEKYALRVGMHHFSGHYGDEMLERLYTTNKINAAKTQRDGGLIENYPSDLAEADHSYYFIEPVEYVRDNSWLISSSADIPYGFRLYGSLEIPMNPSWLRPLAHCPSNYKNPANKEKDPSMIERIGGNGDDGEHFEDSELDAIESGKDASYKALRAQLGFEWEYEFDEFSLFVSADLQLHQDGKTNHDPFGYSKSNKWEKEISVATGVELNSFVPGKKLAVAALYHNGRFNATQWFYQRYESVSICVIVR